MKRIILALFLAFAFAPTAFALSIFNVPQGGTGWGNIQAGGLMYGNGTSAVATTSQGTGGYVLTWLNGIPIFSATTTYSAPFVFASGNVTCTSASAGVTGCLTGTDWSTFNNKGSGSVTSITLGGGLDGVSPITTTGTITAQVGTSTVPTQGQLAAWASNGTPSNLYSVATGTYVGNNGLTGSAVVIGGNSNIGLASISANSVLGTIGASGIPLAVATSSLFLTSSSVNLGLLSSTDWNTFNGKQAALTATWPQILTGAALSFGWATTSQPSSSNLMVSNGTNGFYGVATGTISGSSIISVTAGRSAIGGALAIDCTTCATFTYPFPSSATTSTLSFANLSFSLATGTQATSTNFFANNNFGILGQFTIVNATGTGAANQSVFQNATFVNSTTTSGTTTTLFATTASTSNLFIASGSCSGTNALNVSAAGKVSCGAVTGVGSASSTLLTDTNTFSGASNKFTNNIVIGTSTPYALLGVQGAYGAQAPLFDVASSTTAGSAATTSIFRISPTGSVGIGNATFAATNPERLLVDMGMTNTSVSAVVASGTLNNFLQFDCKNNSTGSAAQCGYAATENIGDTTHDFMYMGVNNSAFWSPAAYNIGGPHDVSLLGEAGDMFLANGTTTTKNLYFLTGGVSTSTNLRMTILGTGNVGIGTSSPYAMLSVAGNVVAGFFTATSTGVVSQSSFQNITMVNSTTTNATTTSLQVSGLASTSQLTASGGITLPDTFKLTTAQQSFGTYDFNGTTSDIITLRSFHRAATLREVDGIIDCPNGCIFANVGYTVNLYTGQNRSASTTGTLLLTKNFNSTTTLQAVTSFSSTAIAANDIVWMTISAASTTQMSIDITGYVTEN